MNRCPVLLAFSQRFAVATLRSRLILLEVIRRRDEHKNMSGKHCAGDLQADAVSGT